MEDNASNHPSLCRMGCGFFGSAATEDMCSKCFRDYERRKAQQQQQQSSAQTPVSSRRTTEAYIGAVGTSEVHATPLSDLPGPASSSEESPPKTPKKNRCFVCRKKVGLTGFECRCGNLFCGLHRYVDQHNCNFDYKALGREELEKKHPKVVAAKIQKL